MLVHAELATLLELTQAFKEEDFSEIYKKTIAPIIPIELQPLCRPGLGKTAMNVFAAIFAAAKGQNPHPHFVYGPNVYFEQRGMIGENHRIEELKSDLNLPKVDVYAAQFNANINTDNEFVEYEREDVVANIRYLLDSGRAADALTIALDNTIELSSEPNLAALFNAFSEDIQSGRLNIIVFKSGQKFDMLGMDNYFGAPFYIVNNGDAKWRPFDILLTESCHKTDPLSLQWFCLANKYALDSLKQYKDLIFKNARAILDRVPESLKATGRNNQSVRVSNARHDVDICYIDIKVRAENPKEESFKIMKRFYQHMLQSEIKVYSRQGFGFYHPCFLVFDQPATSRLTPGINPHENEALIAFLHSIC